VVPFEQVAQSFPPADHDFFVAVGYRDLNRFRAARCVAARRLGYELASYISPDAVVWNGFRHGGNCFVLEHNTIQPFATIGSNVFLWSGNHIGHHARIADDCFIASHVVVSGGVHIGEGCFIGVNVTIRDHVTIGARCVLGAGALILENTMDEGVYAVKGTERSRVPSTRLRHL
jgi:sugar O-acyltransferase (sialic acid O-acetyltransferase NeuD family)